VEFGGCPFTKTQKHWRGRAIEARVTASYVCDPEAKAAMLKRLLELDRCGFRHGFERRFSEVRAIMTNWRPGTFRALDQAHGTDSGDPAARHRGVTPPALFHTAWTQAASLAPQLFTVSFGG